jgi:hypothetical protein
MLGVKMVRFGSLKQGCIWKGRFGVKRWHTALLLSLFIAFGFVSNSLPSLDWDIRSTLKLEVSPLDVAFISSNGWWVFVLTDQGEILIYSADGKLNNKFTAGIHLDAIEAGPRENILFLTSLKNRTVQVITVNFIYDINVSGSPFKRRADAPVVIAVFNDYQ